MKNKWKLLDANALKIIAVVLMMLDHLWASVIPGNRWMTMLGRCAFPIFAFMVAEGYVHTSDVKKYMKRLFVFALISEIPFNLFYIGAPIFPFHQNVMFTLLYGLLILYQLENSICFYPFPYNWVYFSQKYMHIMTSCYHTMVTIAFYRFL